MGVRARWPLPCPTHHGDLEAHPLRAQQVLLGDVAVFENEVGSGGSPDAQLVLLLAQREARARHGHQEGADALQGTAAFPSSSPEAPEPCRISLPSRTWGTAKRVEQSSKKAARSASGARAPTSFVQQRHPGGGCVIPRIRMSTFPPSFGCLMATVVSSPPSRPLSPGSRPPWRWFPGPFLPMQRPPTCPARPRSEPTLCFRALSVVAKTTAAEASQALVIQALVPFNTHSSPTG